eukprot:g39968.t1
MNEKPRFPTAVSRGYSKVAKEGMPWQRKVKFSNKKSKAHAHGPTSKTSYCAQLTIRDQVSHSDFSNLMTSTTDSAVASGPADCLFIEVPAASHGATADSHIILSRKTILTVTDSGARSSQLPTLTIPWKSLSVFTAASQDHQRKCGASELKRY